MIAAVGSRNWPCQHVIYFAAIDDPLAGEMAFEQEDAQAGTMRFDPGDAIAIKPALGSPL